MEIERKFLITRRPTDLGAFRHRHIEQGYLVWDAQESEVRLRRSDESYKLTLKRGSGMIRDEIEVPLDRQQFEALWPATRHARVEKTRYEIPLGGRTAELDCYHGRLDGLCIVEVEFRSEDEARAFHPPDWFGEEVTSNPRYRSRELASPAEQSGAPLA